jgi:hypothetical protein
MDFSNSEWEPIWVDDIRFAAPLSTTKFDKSLIVKMYQILFKVPL